MTDPDRRLNLFMKALRKHLVVSGFEVGKYLSSAEEMEYQDLVKKAGLEKVCLWIF